MFQTKEFILVKRQIWLWLKQLKKSNSSKTIIIGPKLYINYTWDTTGQI